MPTIDNMWFGTGHISTKTNISQLVSPINTITPTLSNYNLSEEEISNTGQRTFFLSNQTCKGCKLMENTPER